MFPAVTVSASSDHWQCIQWPLSVFPVATVSAAILLVSVSGAQCWRDSVSAVPSVGWTLCLQCRPLTCTCACPGSEKPRTTLCGVPAAAGSTRQRLTGPIIPHYTPRAGRSAAHGGRRVRRESDRGGPSRSNWPPHYRREQAERLATVSELPPPSTLSAAAQAASGGCGVECGGQKSTK